MATLARLVQLWRVQAYLDFLFMVRSFSSFAWYVTADLVTNLGAVATTFLLAERFDGIGAWRKEQIAFMLGYAIVINGLLELLFGFNVRIISRRLGRGQLDHLLLQPQPLWMALLTEGFTPFSQWLTVLPGIAVMVWALTLLPPLVTPGWLALLLLNMVASGVISLAFSYLWGSLAFWAPRAAEEVSSTANRLLERLKPYPLDGLALTLLGGLLTVLPAGFVAWYPCRALLGIEASGSSLLVTPLAALLFGLLAAGLFRRGLDHYARVGCQRYLSFGHRR